MSQSDDDASSDASDLEHVADALTALDDDDDASWSPRSFASAPASPAPTRSSFTLSPPPSWTTTRTHSDEMRSETGSAQAPTDTRSFTSSHTSTRTYSTASRPHSDGTHSETGSTQTHTFGTNTNTRTYTLSPLRRSPPTSVHTLVTRWKARASSPTSSASVSPPPSSPSSYEAGLPGVDLAELRAYADTADPVRLSLPSHC